MSAIRRRRTIAIAVVGIILLLVVAGRLIGGSHMSLFSKSDPLLWQGAADRKPAQFVLIEVTSVKPYTKVMSPSMEGYYPNAQTIEGRRSDGGKVEVRAPEASLPAGLTKGARAVLGLVDPKHVICFLLPPADVPENGIEAWAGQQPCG